LTYKSINDIIKDECGRGRLFPLDPLLSGDPIIRGLYVSEEVKKMLNGPWQTTKEEEEWFTARAILDNFISGRLISVAKTGHNKPKHTMAPLKPYADGVWEIRATKPKPGIRILGMFAEKDLFIALNWQERTLLGSYKSREWRNIIVGCQTMWRNLFTIYPCFKGKDHHDYISNIILN
jgi:hypothetical protein